MSNGLKETCEEVINIIEDGDDTDIFENPPSAKRRDIKATPEKWPSFVSNIPKCDVTEPLKEAQDIDKSFKAIVSKYRTKPSHSFSTIKAFEASDQDSNLEDLILEIRQDKNLFLNDKTNNESDDNTLQVKKNKFKRVVSERQSKQMDCMEDDDALLDFLLKEDALKTESNVTSISGNPPFPCSDKPTNPSFTDADKDEPTASSEDVKKSKHAEVTSLKTSDVAILDDIHKNILPTEQDAPLFHRYGRYRVTSVNREKSLDPHYIFSTWF